MFIVIKTIKLILLYILLQMTIFKESFFNEANIPKV